MERMTKKEYLLEELKSLNNIENFCYFSNVINGNFTVRFIKTKISYNFKNALPKVECKFYEKDYERIEDFKEILEIFDENLTHEIKLNDISVCFKYRIIPTKEYEFRNFEYVNYFS